MTQPADRGAKQEQTSKGFFVGVAANALRWVVHYDTAVSKCLARAMLATALAELPEDMALRVRLWPDTFRAEA